MIPTAAITAAIVGATGYTGVELIRLLGAHPSVNLTTITSRSNQGVRVDDYFPSLRGVCELSFSDANTEALAACDVVFFATPHGVAMKEAKALTDKGSKVIDLAADFRLQDTEAFAHWYKMPHSEPELLTEAVYGLCEVNRERIKNARIIGNPGCYPTTVLLGLEPLLGEADMFDKRIIIDAKSGVSGAGKKAEESLIFSELSDNFKAYGVAGHRHSAEIYQGLNAKQKGDYDVLFTPHLLPMVRGMFSTMYIKLSEKAAAMNIQALYEARYADEPFVDVMPKGSLPETRSVRASNRLRIALHQDGYNLRILVVQDNLVKGAAGQAVQNMNIAFGLGETLGLLHTPISP